VGFVLVKWGSPRSGAKYCGEGVKYAEMGVCIRGNNMEATIWRQQYGGNNMAATIRRQQYSGIMHLRNLTLFVYSNIRMKRKFREKL
jgi:hypothetical protein